MNSALWAKVMQEIKSHMSMALYHVYLAWQKSLDTIRDFRYDSRLGIETTGYYIPRNPQTFFGDEFRYGTMEYSIFEKIIPFLQLNENDIFVDIGCGKGRAVLYAATRKIKKVIGIEYEKSLVDIARKNISSFKALKTEIEIIQADAGTYETTEGTVFFLNNPFGYKTLIKVLDNIRNSTLAYPRKVRIAYYGKLYKVLLDTAGWLEPEGEINGTGFFVWHNVLN
ncbi:MAG: methyltransferase domain-containing protein [Candidatus Omnitrophota bacterium]|nr:methyltransferase domain-containing protein [Candidatus Omnitrophota bacterium]